MKSLLFAILWTQLCIAGILHVPEDHAEIQSAILQAVSGDTVLVAPGHYVENLSIPDISLTLASHFLISGDTSYVSQTVIDGDSLDSVINIQSTLPNEVIVSGFSIIRGTSQYGGGVLCHGTADLCITHCTFERNAVLEDYTGIVHAVDHAVPFDRYPRNLTVSNLRFRNNYHFDNRSRELNLRAQHNLVVSDVEVLATQDVSAIAALSDDSLFCKGLFIEGLRSEGWSVVGLTSLNYLRLEDFIIQGCVTSGTLLVEVTADSVLEVQNLTAQDNLMTGIDAGLLNLTARYKAFQVDSLVISGNTVTHGNLCGLNFLSSWDYPVLGTARNVRVIGNLAGDSTFVSDGAPGGHGKILFLRNTSLFDAVVSTNTSIVTPDPESPTWGAAQVQGTALEVHAYALGLENVFADTLRIQNCQILDNLLIDLDDYSTPGIRPWANRGRAMGLNTTLPWVEVSDCIFAGNRQPNHVPEVFYDAWMGEGYYSVGCTVQIKFDGDLETSQFEMSDCVLRDNDDGGLRFSGGDVYAHLRNIDIINCQRNALTVGSGDPMVLENILIDGTHEVDPIGSYSVQCAVLTNSYMQDVSCSNFTIINCNTPGFFNHIGEHNLVFQNSIFWNNNYDRLQANPFYGPFVPVAFSYTFSQYPVDGQNNQIGMNPLFDSEMGSPFLAVDSPCIDYGNPDALFNDLEDPDNPGSSLWPSQGQLRNDIGYTGGPNASTLEHLVVVPKKLEEPSSFVLRAPYPNPFNPATTIEYVLIATGELRVSVYNLQGQVVRTLVNGFQSPGLYRIKFDGSGLASGVYFVELVAGQHQEIKKMLYIK